MPVMSADPRRTHGVARLACVSELRRETAQLLHAVARRLARLRGPDAAEPASPGLLPTRRDDRAARGGRLIVVCAWCGKFRVGASWVAAIAATDLERTSHGICPACFAALEGASCDATRG